MKGERMRTDQLTKPDILNLPVKRQICFSNHKNDFKERIKQDQIRILTKFAPVLKPLLEPDEEILVAVQATSPMSFIEQWTTGWVIYYLKRCVLIFTNRRILHFPTKYDYTPKHSHSQIRYGDIEKLKLSAFLGRVLTIEYQSGKKEKFYYINSKAFNKLKTLEHLFVMKSHQPSSVRERHFLCPKCITPLLKEVYSCPSCHLEFKNMEGAKKLSILYPGGGYFYTGHPILGIMDAITEGLLIIFLIVNIVGALERIELWGSVFFVAILLSIEKLISIYHAKHYVSEYIPVDKNIGAVPLKAAPEPFSPYKQSLKPGPHKLA
jgi:hypothetical protein